jgi:Nucleotidyltransferase domain
MVLSKETAQPSSPLFQLERVLGSDWPHLRKAFTETRTVVNELDQLLKGTASADSSIVVTGSLGRKEYTQGSDLDWILLVDGAADARDQKTFLTIDRAIHGVSRFKRPGKEGTFGRLAFSQPMVHHIGGEEDSNSNTTRRILLLLEAVAIGENRAFDRVRKGILLRYLNEDRGLFRRDHTTNKTRWVPLFLLNDLTRYWRTVTVDFAYKQFDRGNKGYFLRSVKLGTSRKLMFSSGLLACFWCDPEISKIGNQEPQVQSLIARLDEFLLFTPLERIALFFSAHLDSREASFLKTTALALFGAYDQFIGLLDEQESRERLEALQEEQVDSDETFKRAKSIRTRFREAIQSMFLDNRSPLYAFTIDKGVF